jgi:NTE family protein
MPAKSFIDGPYRIRRIVKYALSGETSAFAEMVLPFFSALKRVKRVHGLNPGNAFYAWLSNVLTKKFHVSSVADLERKLKDIATDVNALFPNSEIPEAGLGKMLKIVATGLPQAAASKSMGIKIIFPDNAALFSPAYAHHSPALFARASMSIPLFFEPLDLTLEPEQWKRWLAAQYCDLLSNVALADIGASTSIAFVDGGLLSNFPVDSFLHAADCGRLSLLPTIGVALAGDPKEHQRVRPGSMAAATKYLLGVLDGMRHVRDRDGKNLARIFDDAKKELHVSVALVDVGSHNWLNFQLETGDMADLYLRGVGTAAKFLDSLRSENR